MFLNWKQPYFASQNPRFMRFLASKFDNDMENSGMALNFLKICLFYLPKPGLFCKPELYYIPIPSDPALTSGSGAKAKTAAAAKQQKTQKIIRRGGEDNFQGFH